MSRGKQHGKQGIWLAVSIFAILVPIIGVVIVAVLNSGDSAGNIGAPAQILSWISLTAAATSIYCIFRTDSWFKVIPIVGIIVGILVALLAQATYWINGIA